MLFKLMCEPLVYLFNFFFRVQPRNDVSATEKMHAVTRCRLQFNFIALASKCMISVSHTPKLESIKLSRICQCLCCYCCWCCCGWCIVRFGKLRNGYRMRLKLMRNNLCRCHTPPSVLTMVCVLKMSERERERQKKTVKHYKYNSLLCSCWTLTIIILNSLFSWVHELFWSHSRFLLAQWHALKSKCIPYWLFLMHKKIVETNQLKKERKLFTILQFEAFNHCCCWLFFKFII